MTIPLLTEFIVNNILALIPVRVIYSYERGVKFHAGLDKATLEPGIYFYVPFLQKIEVVTVVEDTINLPNQSITTMDEVAVTFSANVVYEIADARKYFTQVTDFEQAVTAASMNHLAERIRSKDWSALISEQLDLERSLKNTLTTRVKKWGVEIVSVGITDLTRAKPYRLIMD